MRVVATARGTIALISWALGSWIGACGSHTNRSSAVGVAVSGAGQSGAVALAGAGAGTGAGTGGAGAAGGVGFEATVQPFINKACNCHQSTPVLMAPFSLKQGEAFGNLVNVP